MARSKSAHRNPSVHANANVYANANANAKANANGGANHARAASAKAQLPINKPAGATHPTGNLSNHVFGPNNTANRVAPQASVQQSRVQSASAASKAHPVQAAPATGAPKNAAATITPTTTTTGTATTTKPQIAAQQPKQQQQQHQQHPKQQQLKQQQLKQQQQDKAPAVVYRTGSSPPVHEHADDAFLSGAWLFDPVRVPSWMAAQVPFTASKAAIKAPAKVQAHVPAMAPAHAPAHVMTMPNASKPRPSSALATSKQQQQQQQQQQQHQQQHQQNQPKQQQQQQQKQLQQQQKYAATILRNPAHARPSTTATPQPAHVYTLGSTPCKRATPDDGFESGAWLFDTSAAPQWLATQLPAAKAHPITVRSATTAVAAAKPHSAAIAASKPAFPRPQSSQQQHQQQHYQQQQQQQRRQPEHVYALGAGKASHASPDDAFYSGAWLFDHAAAPQWLQLAVPAAPARSPRAAHSARNGASSSLSPNAAPFIPSRMMPAASQRPSATTATAPTTAKLFSSLAGKAPIGTAAPSSCATPAYTYTLGSAKCKHATADDAFDTGAWLFDYAVAPAWLAAQLPKQQSKQQPQQGAQKPASSGQQSHQSSPTRRPNSARM